MTSSAQESSDRHDFPPPGRPASRRATLIGSTAVLMWGALATLTVLSGDIPPFQLLAMCFTLGTLVGFLWRAASRRLGDEATAGDSQAHTPPPQQAPRLMPLEDDPGPSTSFHPLSFILHPFLLGLYGLFGYHFAYFTALRLAPPVEAGLIAYLWPLLIVLMAALLPGERLRPRQAFGALLGFGGAALLVTRGQGLAFSSQYALGYAFALACAFIWSSYSVLSRRSTAPTSAVTGYCAATAGLALVCHLLLESTVWPSDGEWLAVIALGLGPVGAAFYTWDYGMKRGDIQLLGVLAYAAPLLSTLLLVALGLAEPSWLLAAACGLIVGGAVLASRN